MSTAALSVSPAGGSRPSREPLVRLRGVSKRFPNGTQALDGIDLDLREGEFLSVLGPSGCGKSTLLRLVAGLGQPTGGTIAWADGGEAGGARQRRDIGFVFQDPTLLPWATAAANVALPLVLRGMRRREAGERAAATLGRVGLGGFERAFPRELSVGMRMRVSIARALVTRPRVLLMDEPFAALDEITRHRLNDDLLLLWQEAGFTAVFVTHSVFESVYLADRVVVMAARPGRVFADLPVFAPAPRDALFRTSAEYAHLCRAATQTLHEAIAA